MDQIVGKVYILFTRIKKSHIFKSRSAFFWLKPLCLCLSNGFSNTFALPLAGEFKTIKIKKLQILYFAPEMYLFLWLRRSHQNDQFMKFPKKPLLMLACVRVFHLFLCKRKWTKDWPSLTLKSARKVLIIYFWNNFSAVNLSTVCILCDAGIL